MKKLLLCLTLVLSTPVFAEPPSDSSLKELFDITNTKAMTEQMFAQTDSFIKPALDAALQGQEVTPEVRKSIDEAGKKMFVLMQQEMGWDKLEPEYIELYKKSFSQSDVDGIIQFYKSPAGQSVIQKMPVVMQNCMALMQTHMVAIMPKIQEIIQDTVVVAVKKDKKSSKDKTISTKRK